MRIFFVYILLSVIPAVTAMAQTPAKEAKMAAKLERFFERYKPKDASLPQAPRMLGYKVDNARRTLTVTADATFAAQEFTGKLTEKIYKDIRKQLPKPYNRYTIKVVVNGMPIETLATDMQGGDRQDAAAWEKAGSKGNPWVSNMSLPVKITHGLNDRHLSLWASHGRYYDCNKDTWKWQRPKLFCTTEDLYTQTIVVPYLIPMLENAGANVFTPRERDWQKHEVIVDNDNSRRGTEYIEVSSGHGWQSTGTGGFAFHPGNYVDGENPFTAGTARMARTTGKKNNFSMISYQPDIPAEGRYAVYVSYQTLPESIDDACYTVWHKGEKTTFRVNQQMGGGTWVYLGTFDFDKGSSEFNRVTLTNQSRRKGVVTADAVRFGGGMGNIERGGAVSGLPRCLEGARYYAQWAGMPYSVYSSKNGTDDYKDDINTRSLMTNRLGGGSRYMPSKEGCKVPIELSLAVHSDAGFANDGAGLVGSLAICTTNTGNGKLGSGLSRSASRDFASSLLTNMTRDITSQYGRWNRRDLYDRNYSETRIPEVPSAIIETMSHQNFPDMRYGQDPNFRFTLARSIYKTILRYLSGMHGRPCIVSPLTPDNFSIEFTAKDEVELRWNEVKDPLEPTAQPTGYIIYTSTGHSDFDNGTYVRASNRYRMRLEPGVLYSFKVAAVNRGGISFPTGTLCALYNPAAEETVMIVDGFHRLSSPAIRDNEYEQGFDFREDPGVTEGPTAGWVGEQLCYDRTRMGIEDESGLGWSDDNFTGMFIAGNDRTHVRTHAEAIMAAGRYSIASCSSEAWETEGADIGRYRVTDFILGLERNDGRSLRHYKSFSLLMRSQMKEYIRRGGSVLVSGAYIGCDMPEPEEQTFLASVLKCQYAGSGTGSGVSLYGMNTTMDFYNTINEEHYAATSRDHFLPVAPAYTALKYSDDTNAAVAYHGNDYRSFALGIPFECIKDGKKRTSIMRGILDFLVK
ncbi:MAG: xanthan lyase [Prevotella sp.]|nr:xanthan lyase [Prevotella sp.]